jgi:hypothetical protein
VLSVELVVFELIITEIRYKCIQVGLKLGTYTDDKDSILRIEEPLFTELELQHRFLSLAQSDRIQQIIELLHFITSAFILRSENIHLLIINEHGFYDLVVI